MKRLEEMLGTQFILKCSCGMSMQEDKVKFGVCRWPYYNDRLNAIVCERCGQPACLSKVSPEEVKNGSEVEQAVMNGYFVLHSDRLFLSTLEDLKTRREKESKEELIPVEDLFK